MYITDYIKTCTPVCIYSDQEREEGSVFRGGGFDLGLFGDLLHSPLGNFGRLHLSLHPSLQVSIHSLHPSLQVGPSQLLLLLTVYGCGSVLLLCRGNLIDDHHELPIPVNLKQSKM